MTHTPGPWVVNIDRDYAPDDEEGELITLDILRDAPALHEYQLIAELFNSFYLEDESLANAHLIAAAPALLKALERTEQTVRNLAANIPPGKDIWQIAMNEAANLRADIAAAKGN